MHPKGRNRNMEKLIINPSKLNIERPPNIEQTAKYTNKPEMQNLARLGMLYEEPTIYCHTS
jgi:hypothetical protein